MHEYVHRASSNFIIALLSPSCGMKSCTVSDTQLPFLDRSCEGWYVLGRFLEFETHVSSVREGDVFKLYLLSMSHSVNLTLCLAPNCHLAQVY